MKSWIIGFSQKYRRNLSLSRWQNAPGDAQIGLRRYAEIDFKRFRLNQIKNRKLGAESPAHPQPDQNLHDRSARAVHQHIPR